MEAREPCIDCPDKVIDSYGYFCDLSCGKRTAWLNYMVGIKEVVEWVEHHTNGDRMEVITKFLCISEIEWQAKLKEWGI